MSLEKSKDDVQPTELQSEQKAYYSREKLKRDAQRIHNQLNHTSISKPQEAEKQAEMPLPELDQINLMIRDLAQQSGATSEEAKRGRMNDLAHIGNTSNVPALEELFNDCKLRNREDSRKRTPKSEHTGTVRRKCKSINR